MFKTFALAAAIALSSAAAMAQTTAAPIAAPASGARGAHTPDPAKFAERKAELQARRAKTDACIAAASEGKAVMECMKGEREGMRRPSGAGAGAAPTVPAAK